MTDLSAMPPLNALAENIRRAHGRMTHGEAEWVEGFIEMAAYMHHGRKQHASDMAFSHWIVDNKVDFHNNQDRAAFWHMGEDLALLRTVLEETERRSPQHIWLNEMKPRLDKKRFAHVSKPESTALESKTPILPAQTAPTSQNQESANSTEVKSTASVAASPELFGGAVLPKGNLVANRILDRRAATAITHMVKENRKAGLRVWDLLVQSIESGVFGPAIDNFYFSSGTGIGKQPVGLRVIIPWIKKKTSNLNLLKPEVAEFVSVALLPAIAANRDKIDAEALNEGFIRSVRVDYENDLRAKSAPVVTVVKSVKPPQEYPIMAYGRHLWPRTDELTFDEVRYAVWFVDYLLGLSKDRSPGSVRIGTNHLMKFIYNRALGWDRAVRLVLDAYQANPDGETRCELPPNFFHKQ